MRVGADKREAMRVRADGGCRVKEWGIMGV
jgi:hypothetical protein